MSFAPWVCTNNAAQDGVGWMGVHGGKRGLHTEAEGSKSRMGEERPKGTEGRYLHLGEHGAGGAHLSIRTALYLEFRYANSK